jgi:5'-deoxynucleotidase YfbR-like HD superfamily hydrolase
MKSRKSKKSDWIETQSGQKVWVIEPTPDTIRIDDIAHALSLLCRFNGHCKRLYTVGEHLLLCDKIYRRRFGKNPLERLQLLLHDSPEAYLGDVTRPLKAAMPQYKLWESQMEKTIYQALNIPPPTKETTLRIKQVDDIALLTERRDLLSKSGHTWTIKGKPDPKPIKRRKPKATKKQFLKLFYKLLNQLKNHA